MAENDWLTAVDDEILEELAEGARTKGYLVEATGRHRNTIGQHLKLLRVDGAIECIHEPTALYKLEADPREDSE